MNVVARSYVWWPEMDKQIENVAESFQQCQNASYEIKRSEVADSVTAMASVTYLIRGTR